MSDAPKKAKGGKKGRKIGRNKVWCQGYRAAGRQEASKVRRLVRHLKKQPGCPDAVAALSRLTAGRPDLRKLAVGVQTTKRAA